MQRGRGKGWQGLDAQTDNAAEGTAWEPQRSGWARVPEPSPRAAQPLGNVWVLTGLKVEGAKGGRH